MVVRSNSGAGALVLVLLLILPWGRCAAGAEANPHLEAARAIHALWRGDGTSPKQSPACEFVSETEGKGTQQFVVPSIWIGDRRLDFLTSASAVSARGSEENADAVEVPEYGSAGLIDTRRALKLAHTAQAPRSALVSDPGILIDSSSMDWNRWRFTVFSRFASGEGQLLAVVAKSLQAFGGDDHIIWFPQASSALSLTVLEYLYAHALGLEATRRFHFVEAQGHSASIGATSGADDHAQVLRLIAVARQCQAAVNKPQPGVAVVPWRAVVIDPDRGQESPENIDTVGVRVSFAGAAIQDADVMFWRLPHSGCSAKTGPGGSAACRLEDVEGHQKHPGFETAPVVATFPGRVGRELVLLPTSRVISR